MALMLQLSATRWLNFAQVALVDYEPEGDLWCVHLCGQPEPITLTADEGAVLAYYVQRHASPDAYNQTQRRRAADGR
jgi:hypothetical protein